MITLKLNKRLSDNFVKDWDIVVTLFPNAVARMLSEQSDKAFETQSWNNNTWSKNKFGKTPSLVKSGRMKNSIRTKTKKKSATIYSNIDYASYQQNGTTTIPSRQFMGESKELEKLIEAFFTKEIKKRF